MDTNQNEAIASADESAMDQPENNSRAEAVRKGKRASTKADIPIARRMPYEEMVNNKWIPESKYINLKVRDLRNFFEVQNLRELFPYYANLKLAYEKQTIAEPADCALMAWIQKARLEARNLTVSEADLDLLNKILPEIKKLSRSSPNYFCGRLEKSLAGCGIAVVFLPRRKGVFTNGFTFYDGSKIIITLTLKGSDSDKFWFGLFHEIGHIMLGHVNENGTTEDDEKEADEYAENQFIPHEKFRKFISAHNYEKLSIVNFANELEIAPGVVVGRMQEKGCITFSQYNDLKVKYNIVPKEY